MWKRIKTWWKRKWCDHSDFTIKDRLGPTYRGKVWLSCRCDACGQWFLYERHCGRRYMVDGPGFGFKSIS